MKIAIRVNLSNAKLGNLPSCIMSKVICISCLLSVAEGNESNPLTLPQSAIISRYKLTNPTNIKRALIRASELEANAKKLRQEGEAQVKTPDLTSSLSGRHSSSNHIRQQGKANIEKSQQQLEEASMIREDAKKIKDFYLSIAKESEPYQSHTIVSRSGQQIPSEVLGFFDQIIVARRKSDGQLMGFEFYHLQEKSSENVFNILLQMTRKRFTSGLEIAKAESELVNARKNNDLRKSNTIVLEPKNKDAFNANESMPKSSSPKVAENDTKFTNMSLIPAGEFTMGDNNIDQDDIQGVLLLDSSDAPKHQIYVSEFYLSKKEVQKAEWEAVRSWGMLHGYSDLSAGIGKAANHPIENVSWFDAVKWCNARSERENLTPCYTVSGVTYRTGEFVPDCNWDAQGYRLPSEAEWEKAARGGLHGKRFPWGDTISLDQANFYSMINRRDRIHYDKSRWNGRHQEYGRGHSPYTAPVGSFEPNNFDLYDMSGNVNEWCWDIYNEDYYAISCLIDPRGPSSGIQRVYRGGGSNSNAWLCSVALRHFCLPKTPYNRVGLRVARTSNIRIAVLPKKPAVEYGNKEQHIGDNPSDKKNQKTSYTLEERINNRKKQEEQVFREEEELLAASTLVSKGELEDMVFDMLAKELQNAGGDRMKVATSRQEFAAIVWDIKKDTVENVLRDFIDNIPEK